MADKADFIVKDRAERGVGGGDETGELVSRGFVRPVLRTIGTVSVVSFSLTVNSW